MPSININLQEPAWPDLEDKAVHHVTAPIGITGLADGTASGRPSVAIRIDLPDGSAVLAETTLALFLTAADALKSRFGDPRPLM